MTRAALLAVLGLCALPCAALTPDLPPGARKAAETQEALGSYAVPVGPWSDGTLPTRATEGATVTTAWQVPSAGTTLQLLAPLRDQLEAEGWTTLFDCDADLCGGFDFRYSTKVLPEPAMHVDLGDFRFLSATRAGAEGPEYATVLVSRRAGQGFVQVVRVSPPGAAPVQEVPDLATKTPQAAETAPAAAPDTVVSALEEQGRTVIRGLAFETGSAQLSPGRYPALEALAAWLLADPARQITLVGHTDAQGALDVNLSLSRARAQSVADRLVTVHGVPAGQVTAEGVGFLLPLASNDTEEGRALNRRVEAVLLSAR